MREGLYCETGVSRWIDNREAVVVVLDADKRECCSICMEPENECGFCNHCA